MGHAVAPGPATHANIDNGALAGIVRVLHGFDKTRSIDKVKLVRKMTWSGDVPADADEARDRIIRAAMRCIAAHSADRASLGAIAEEAGVSRPTLYAYFENREDLMEQVLLVTAESYVEHVLAHARKFDTAAERLVELMVYAATEIRTESGLAASVGVGSILQGPLSAEEVYFARVALGPVMELSPQLGEWIDDAAELAARVFVSMLNRESPVPRSDDEKREFLYQWFPRAMGIVDDDGPTRR